VPSGSLVVIPLRIKEGGERVCFMVHFGEPLPDPTAVKLPGLRLPASVTALEPVQPEASQIKSAAATSAAALPGPEPEQAPARAAAPPPGASASQQAARKEEGKSDSRVNDEEVGSARRPRASVAEEKDVKVGKRRCSRSESAGRSESRNRKRRKQRSPSHRNRREDKKKDRDRDRRSRSRGRRGAHQSNSRRRSRGREKEKVVEKDSSRRDFKEESSRFRDRDTRKGSTPMGFRELASRKREERSSPPPSPPAGVPPRQEAPPGPPPLPRGPTPPRPADDKPEEKPPPPPPEAAPPAPQSLGSLLSGEGLLSSVHKELAASRQDAEPRKPSPRRAGKSPPPAGKVQAGKSASAEPSRRRRASRWGAPTDEAPSQPPEPAPPAQPAPPQPAPPQPAAPAPPKDAAAPSPPPGPAAAKAPPPPQAAAPPAGPPPVTDTAKQAGIIAMTQQLQLAQTQYATVYAQAQQLLATVGQANPQYQQAFALAQECQRRVQSAELALRQVQQGGAVPAAAPAQMQAVQTPGMPATAEVPTFAKAPMQVSQQIAGDPLAAGVCKAKGCGARPFSAPTEAPLPTDFALVGKAKATAPPPRPQLGGAEITSLDAVPPKSVGVDLVPGGGGSTYAKSIARPPPRHAESVDAEGGQDAEREKNNSFRQGGGLANLNCRSKGGDKGSSTDKGGWKGKEKGAGKEDRGGWKGGDRWNDGGKGGGKDGGKAKGRDWDGSGGNNKGGWDPDYPPWRGGGRPTRWDDE